MEEHKTANKKITRSPYFLAASILAYFLISSLVCCSHIFILSTRGAAILMMDYIHHPPPPVSQSVSIINHHSLLAIEPRRIYPGHRAFYYYWAIVARYFQSVRSSYLPSQDIALSLGLTRNVGETYHEPGGRGGKDGGFYPDS